MIPKSFSAIIVLLLITSSSQLHAQPPGGGRTHRITQKGQLNLVPEIRRKAGSNRVTIKIVGKHRVISSNGIPEHKTGSFPNRGNPNRITEQRYVYRVPAKPKQARRTTELKGAFGVAINGVPFDPGAAEFYVGQQGTKWQYEPLSGAIALGIDVSHAHVQPNGAYHYHGLPTGLLENVAISDKKHSPLIGWAADGFPIYAVYGIKSSPNKENSHAEEKPKVVALKSSYQLKKGKRPGGKQPGGKYDGTFVGDYQYVKGSGDLDECNGMFCKTPEFPDGTYAYFLTEDWPVIPRKFKGTPSNDFAKGPGRGGNRGRRFGPRFGPRHRPPGGRRRE